MSSEELAEKVRPLAKEADQILLRQSNGLPPTIIQLLAKLAQLPV